MSKEEPWYKSEWFKTLRTVFFIVIGVLFVGLLINASLKANNLLRENLSPEEKLKKVNKRIVELEKLKIQFEKKIKRILMISRVVIGVIILTLNFFYLKYWTGDSDDLLGTIVNFNSILLLLYSFLAFILCGTIEKFRMKMESIVKFAFGSSGMGAVFELDILKKEKEKILQQLKQ